MQSSILRDKEKTKGSKEKWDVERGGKCQKGLCENKWLRKLQWPWDADGHGVLLRRTLMFSIWQFLNIMGIFRLINNSSSIYVVAAWVEFEDFVGKRQILYIGPIHLWTRWF